MKEETNESKSLYDLGYKKVHTEAKDTHEFIKEQYDEFTGLFFEKHITIIKENDGVNDYFGGVSLWHEVYDEFSGECLHIGGLFEEEDVRAALNTTIKES